MKNFSKGRSMIEMLGVLAVIGVLSIGGLIGFSYAMNNLKASNLSRDIFQTAFFLDVDNTIRNAAIGQAGRLPTGVYHQETDFVITYQRLSDRLFQVKALDVPEKVCTHLFKVQMSATVKRYVGDALFESAVQCATTNTIAYTFTIPMKDNPTDEDSGGEVTPPGSEVPCNGSCIGCQTCNEVTNLCEDDDTRCMSGKECTNGSCVCIDGVDVEEMCRECSDSATWDVSLESECLKCQGRSWFNGKCYPACKAGSFRNDAGICRECIGNIYKVTTTADECARCSESERVYEYAITGISYCRKICSGSTPVAALGSCVACAPKTNEQFFEVFSEAECNKCGSDWVFSEFTSVPSNPGRCYRPCNEGEVRDQKKSCRTCGPEIAYLTEEVCHQCPNNTNYWDYQYKMCRSCDTSTMRTATLEECHRCDNRFVGNDDACLGCKIEINPFVSEAECDRCPERAYLNGRCYKTCAQGDGYIRSKAETCYSCAQVDPIDTTAKICARCPQRTYNASTGLCELTTL